MVHAVASREKKISKIKKKLRRIIYIDCRVKPDNDKYVITRFKPDNDKYVITRFKPDNDKYVITRLDRVIFLLLIIIYQTAGEDDFAFVVG